jgi:hypothetical protein
MKLAEALILRADCQKRIAQLRQRLNMSAKVQEGDQPPEDPQQLMAELEGAIAELTRLIKQINKTNTLTEFRGGTLSDALAERDTLLLKRNAYNDLVQTASVQQNLYSRSEIRFVNTVNVAAIRQQVDAIARDYRQLDSQVQALNWQTDLIET